MKRISFAAHVDASDDANGKEKRDEKRETRDGAEKRGQISQAIDAGEATYQR